MDTSYLQQKRRTWYVQIRVPAKLVPVIGKRLLCRSLKTRDVAEAVRRKHAVLAEWHKRLQLAESLQNSANDHPMNQLIACGRQLADEIQAGELHPEEALEDFTDESDYLHERWMKENPDKWVGDLASAQQVQVIQGLRKALSTGTTYTALSDAIASYISTDKDRLRPSTLQQRRTRLNAFKEWRGDCELGDICKAEAGTYVSAVLEPRGLATATLKHTLGDLSTFFNWCCGRGLCENNPFDGVSRTIRTVKRGVRASGKELRPWSDDELLKLLTQTKAMSDLWVMAVLALYTGMRENELAEAKCDDVTTDEYGTWIAIPEAKTPAGRRNVPVHPCIAPLVAHLLDTSTDGYLVSGLKPGGYDNKRNHLFVKRFSYHKRVKLKLPAALKFHGLRKNCATALSRAGVPVDRVEQLIGHTHGNLAQDVYIDGALPVQLAQDVQSLSHGKTIDDTVATILLGCTGEPDQTAGGHPDVKLTVIR